MADEGATNEAVSALTKEWIANPLPANDDSPEWWDEMQRRVVAALVDQGRSYAEAEALAEERPSMSADDRLALNAAVEHVGRPQCWADRRPAWAAAGLSPGQMVHIWGTLTAADAQACTDELGLSPEEIVRWAKDFSPVAWEDEYGNHTPADVVSAIGPWVKAGIEPAEAVGWFVLGISAPDAVERREMGIDPHLAIEHSDVLGETAAWAFAEGREERGEEYVFKAVAAEMAPFVAPEAEAERQRRQREKPLGFTR